MADKENIILYRQKVGALVCFIVFHCFFCNTLNAQQGQPFVTNFPPLSYSSNDYISSPQNWCVERDVNGKIVAANSSGILIYDGVEWQMIPETESKFFNKLAKDKNGTIFTGGVEDLGFLKANEQGEMKYHSLLNQLEEENRDFGRITNVVSFKGDILFRSKSHLIRYSHGKFKIWRPENEFVKLVSSSAGLFISEKSQWYRFQNDSLHQIANSIDETLPNLRAVFQGPENTLLVVSRDNGLFYLKNGKISLIPLDIGQLTVINACELTQNKFALATNEKGVVIINNKGDVLKIINESKGLNGSSAIFPSYTSGELWVSMNSGISLIEFPISISILDKQNGLSGFALCATEFQNNLLVGTYDKAFWVEADSMTAKEIFLPLKEEIKEIFGVVNIGNRLVIANTGGLLVISNNQRYKIEAPANFGCSALIASTQNKNSIYASYRDMIVPIRIDDKSYEQIGAPIKLSHMVYSMAEQKNGNLWAAYEGVSYIDFSKGLDNPKITTLDSLNGLTSEMGIFEVSSVNEQILFGTELGVYSYNHKTKKLEPNPIFGKQFCDGSRMAYNLTEMRNGDVWVTTNRQTGILRKQADNSFIYDSLAIIRAPISDVWDIYEDDDGIVWISGTEAVVRYDPSVEVEYNIPYNAFLRSVVINDNEKIFAGFYSDKNGNPSVKQPESYIPTLEYSENDITFKYGAAYYSKDPNSEYPRLEYSVMLVGRNDSWSSWSKSDEKDYTNLHEGEYTFKVRSRIVYRNGVYGHISEEAAYKFIILPPWYRTGWAYTLFIISGMILLFIILRLNSARLVREKKKLEGIVTERTEEVRKQKDEITEQAVHLKEAYQRLVEMDNFKVSMTSMIVHDLKNPLNAILNTSLEEADEDQLKKIKQSGRQMLTMVLNILDVYKYENSKMQVDKLPVEIDKLIKGALDDIKYLAEQKSIEINVNLSQSATVVGDAEVLGRLIVNLLTNAIKFSPSMSVIDLTGSVLESRFKIEVKDHGTGIIDKDLETIFDKYKQANITDSGGVRSTGLGLTFCRMATEAHDGTIGVESEFGKGSTFWFDLPIPESSSVTEVERVIGGVSAPQISLSKEVIAFLKPHALELSQIPYYKISTLRRTTHKIEPPENIKEAVNKWLGQFKEAAALADRDLINKLINEVLDEDI